MAWYIYKPGTMITIDGTVRQMRGYPKCGASRPWRTAERAGFRGHAQVDDFQSQSIGDGADGGGDEAHALRGIEHHGEAPHTDEREQHAQQAVDDGVQSERLESLRIQVHDRSDHPACQRGHQNDAQHVGESLHA